ncbi:MAG TPA: polysaccharide biosynthesis/export family protein [Amaricoccus sp.]|uniref:polysaccharide biosynthesis/export family protein n=1 Tax=Amaricoccus sp. TaxID=1872485 RepID=UPI002BAF5656|nr:polysaccharide biosynthesis/export family protein [Amaricoccus sp.]HRO10070.1 polysaccharide biosynthesis/export family protein [Amaricoccus sp.]
MIPRALLLLALLAAPAAAEDYRLQQGDVLELVVLAPPMREQLPVDLDGKVTLPVAGPIAAAGRTLAELTAETRDRLAAATLPTRIWPGGVSLALAGYRPVYVGGEVRAAGAFPFVPGLTARRAVALAGGRMPDAALRRLELEGRLAELEAQRAAAADRLARLRQELDPETTGALPHRERAILDHRRAQDEAATTHFATAIRHTRDQIAELASQLATETEGMVADRADFEQIEDMREAGTATALRLSDARRALLFSTTRQLQTATELARTTRELGSLRYEELRRTLDLRLAALTDAADQARLLAGLDARIAATRRQLAWLGAPDAPAPISITRSDGSTLALAAGDDVPLRPGDLVTVDLPSAPAID